MSISFNLVDQPWLPCLFEGEGQIREVSLSEALVRAHEIRRLATSSPLATVALHRLLVAVLHRAVEGPQTASSWLEIWLSGRFSEITLLDYLHRWTKRFDLFDPTYPFYQTSGLDQARATSVAKLSHQKSAGNNALLFDHSVDQRVAAITFGEAARELVALQAFALGGLVTRLPGDPPSAESTHLVKAAVLLVTGRSLFETLILNMLPVDGDAGRPFEFDQARDLPAWERDESTRPAQRPLDGYLDLLTRQSRRVRLIPTQQGFVDQVVVMDGYRLPREFRTADREPMVACTLRNKPQPGQDPEPPVGFRPERALWRDSVPLLKLRGTEGRAPWTLRFLAELRQEGQLDRREIGTLAAYGLSSDRAKIFLWRHEEIPLHLDYLKDDDLMAMLELGVRAAEDAGATLKSEIRRLAELSLAPNGNADKDRVTALYSALAPERQYWPRLDAPFRAYMHELINDYAFNLGEGARTLWARAIRAAAAESFESVARGIETSGHGLHAAAEARGRFYGRLYGALEPLTTTGQEVAA